MNEDCVKLSNIVRLTELKADKVELQDIPVLMKNVDPAHYPAIQACIKARNEGMLGRIMLMALYQQFENEVTHV